MKRSHFNNNSRKRVIRDKSDAYLTFVLSYPSSFQRALTFLSAIDFLQIKLYITPRIYLLLLFTALSHNDFIQSGCSNRVSRNLTTIRNSNIIFYQEADLGKKLDIQFFNFCRDIFRRHSIVLSYKLLFLFLNLIYIYRIYRVCICNMFTVHRFSYRNNRGDRISLAQYEA